MSGRLSRFPRDEQLTACRLSALQAVLFDMDGTLVDSRYDWPAIRRQLGVTGPPILDQLEQLPEPERGQRLAQLEEIEERATREATLAPGAHELLAVLTAHGVKIALVTNNTLRNTTRLLQRFGLEFGVVITRDLGLRKPSPEPMVAAMKGLGVDPARTLSVGDSTLDIQAARAADCGSICALGAAAEDQRGAVDLVFTDLPALTRYLQLVL